MKLNDGLSKTESSSFSMENEENNNEPPSASSIFHLILQEARAVSLWSCISIMLRMAIVFLVTLAAYRHDKQALRLWFGTYDASSPASQEVWTTVSVFSGWILAMAPSKLLTQQAPGFIFANPL
jgi:hypothetical protein